MNRGKIKSAPLLLLLGCCFTVFTATSVQAKLTPKQARTAITRMAGFELPSGSVRVKSISETNSQAEVTADIRMVFKFAQDQQGKWRVAEVRTGQDRWDDIGLIANALGRPVIADACTAPDPPARGSQAVDPSMKRVRCLLGSLLNVEVPSDAVRIQAVTPMAVPFASQASATVVAWMKVDARLLNDKRGWSVSELRTGTGDWVRLEPLVAAVSEEKRKRAWADMELIAGALERFRQDRGSYIVSDSQAVAIDHLSPRYLAQVIRVDPWHHPYKYQGDRDRFTLRSVGADGKENTTDDVVLGRSQ